MPAINIFFVLNLFTCVQSYFINGDDIISASFENHDNYKQHFYRKITKK